MPTTGDNLSLGKLGRAVGHSSNYTTQTRLAADGRDNEIETSMSDFYISAVSTMTVPLSVVIHDTNSTATVYFSNAGSLFLSRIANRTQNFTWDETLGEIYFHLIESSDYTAPISYLELITHTAVNIAFTAKFHEAGQSDGFNDHATDYNTIFTETVTILEEGPS